MNNKRKLLSEYGLGVAIFKDRTKGKKLNELRLVYAPVHESDKLLFTRYLGSGNLNFNP
jgi:hypothetical protein